MGFIGRWLKKQRRMRQLALVADAWALLPDAIREDEDAQRVPILVREVPSAGDRATYQIRDDAAGIFVETDDVDADAEANAGSPAARHGAIVLYLRNIRPRTAKAVAGVLLHEIAHALGLDDHHAEAVGL